MPDASAWYERVVSRNNDGDVNQFAIVEQSKNAVILSCMLFGLEASSGRAKTGYLLGSRHWGRGYMREALAALVTFAFSELALRRLDAVADARNIRPHRFLLSLVYGRWADFSLPPDFALTAVRCPGAMRFFGC